jgi:hypothetical protein
VLNIFGVKFLYLNAKQWYSSIRDIFEKRVIKILKNL